jgi:hypothetical protein
MNDFNFHGLPPRLNQAFDANKSSGASLWNNPITRRSFLKRSGAATVGMICLQTTYMANTAQAEEANTSASFSYEWGLVCLMDPGGNHDPEEDDEAGHNNLADERTWWKREMASWSGGGDNAVLLEIKGTGPVAGRLIQPGDLPDIRSSFTIKGSIKAAITADANDGDNVWEGRFFNISDDHDNVDDDEMAHDSGDLVDGLIQINNLGEVSYHNIPPLITPLVCACAAWYSEQSSWDGGVFGGPELDDSDNYWWSYKLVGAGMITPAMQILAKAGIVAVTKTTASYTVGITAGSTIPTGSAPVSVGVNASYTITSESVPQEIPASMAWAFNKMRRKCYGTTPKTYGEWENMGSATYTPPSAE